MKNITVSVDDDTYRLARIKAAERETSVSALVKTFLTDLAQDPPRSTSRPQSMMRFLDTHILLYSIGDAPDEKRKRDINIEILAGRDNGLSVQVLQEFYVQATRPTRQNPLDHEVALGFIRSWLRFPVQDVTLAVMSDALEIRAKFELSYWDAAIIAAADALRCDVLLSEDMSHGQVIAGVRITNPFR